MIVRGHGLRHEGRYWNGYAYVSGGLARGSCQCGDQSEPVTSAAARKRWHREHKEAIQNAGVPKEPAKDHGGV